MVLLSLCSFSGHPLPTLVTKESWYPSVKGRFFHLSLRIKQFWPCMLWCTRFMPCTLKTLIFFPRYWLLHGHNEFLLRPWSLLWTLFCVKSTASHCTPVSLGHLLSIPLPLICVYSFILDVFFMWMTCEFFKCPDAFSLNCCISTPDLWKLLSL